MIARFSLGAPGTVRRAPTVSLNHWEAGSPSSVGQAYAELYFRTKGVPVKRLVIISVVGLLLTPSIALAVTRTVGQTIVYDFNEIIHSTASIPAGMSQQNREKMEAAQNKPQSFVLTLNLDDILADGKAHAKASLVNSASANAPASLRDPSSNFIATLAPDGEITAQYDPNMQPKTGAGGVILNLTDLNLNNVGGQLMTHFPYFNAFAKGCAMRPHAAAHAAWHDTMMDSLVGQRTFDFVATDKDRVTMKGDFKNQYMSQTISASGDCDPATGLVVDYHEEVNNVMTNGAPSSITRELKLRQ